MKTDMWAVVLAGGKSQRMKKDKSTLLLNNNLLINYTLNLTKQIFKKTIILANENNMQKLKNNYKNVFVDLIKDKGPVGGIYSAFKIFNENNLFFISCDTPFIKKEIIELILENYKDKKSDIVLCQYKKIQPLLGIYTRKCMLYLKKEIQKIRPCILNIYPSLNVKIIAEKEVKKFDTKGLSFFNINNKLNLRKAEEMIKDAITVVSDKLLTTYN